MIGRSSDRARSMRVIDVGKRSRRKARLPDRFASHFTCPSASTKQHCPLVVSFLAPCTLKEQAHLIRLPFDFADSSFSSHFGPSSSYHISRLCLFFSSLDSLSTPSFLSFCLLFSLFSLLSVFVSALVGAVLSYSVRYRFLRQSPPFQDAATYGSSSFSPFFCSTMLYDSVLG